ncbi:MAG: S1C family serine protease [Dehalococcoidales bacterium]
MKRVKYILTCLIIIIPLCLGSSCIYVETPSPPPSPPPEVTAPTSPEWTLPPAETQGPLLPDLVSVVAKVKPSVVAINTEVVTYDVFNRPFTQEGAGSGWIIDKDGLILTNNHVVAGAETITVTLADGRTFPAGVVGADALSDLAVLRVDETNLPEADIGDSSRLRIGEWVLAIGNALGMGITAKEGIISRLGVSVPVSAGQTLYDLIETSAPINPGNSGGPLVNMAGEVIGITSAKLAAVEVEGLGYAISSNSANPIIEELVQKGYVVRPWLGVVLYTVDQYAVFRYRLAVDKGTLITEIGPGSPADKAGLKVGDVIVSFDGKEITTAQELIQAIHSGQIGQEVEITYWRGETENTTRATLIERPPP